MIQLINHTSFNDNLFGNLALTANIDAWREVITAYAYALQIEVFNRSVDIVSRNLAEACCY